MIEKIDYIQVDNNKFLEPKGKRTCAASIYFTQTTSDDWSHVKMFLRKDVFDWVMENVEFTEWYMDEKKGIRFVNETDIVGYILRWCYK